MDKQALVLLDLFVRIEGVDYIAMRRQDKIAQLTVIPVYRGRAPQARLLEEDSVAEV
jgi:hypothetical protein